MVQTRLHMCCSNKSHAKMLPTESDSDAEFCARLSTMMVYVEQKETAPLSVINDSCFLYCWIGNAYQYIAHKTTVDFIDEPQIIVQKYIALPLKLEFSHSFRIIWNFCAEADTIPGWYFPFFFSTMHCSDPSFALSCHANNISFIASSML